MGSDGRAGKSGRVAIVTGASSGIGAAAAEQLAADGFTVYGTSRRAAAGEIRGGVRFWPLDVDDDRSVADLVRGVLARSGRIDVLVNNAGFGIAGAAEESSIEQARALFETNFFGAIRMTQAVLPVMRERGSGRIVNISSVLGVMPAPFGALYAASKHALEGWSESLDHEVRGSGIRVVLVEPAYTKTSFGSNVVAVDRPLSLYGDRRTDVDDLLSESIAAGDEPKVVGEVIARAATAARPRLRYPAGKLARRVTKARRLAPPAIFDRQIRKFNGL